MGRRGEGLGGVLNPFRYPRLRPGSSIALIAPSSPFEIELYEQGREVLQAAGYRVAPGKNIFNKSSYLAGNDIERINDLTAAVFDPSIEAIICIRGGYGSGRLLPSLPFSSFRLNPKIFIGHSDITFLHLALVNQAGWTTFHGPNLTGMAESQAKAENVLEVLTGEATYQWMLDPAQVLRHGEAKGPVLGGNLTCLAHLVGTPYLPNMAGTLLLIEDCSEALYRLDRIMNHLKLAGILSLLGGVILGEFTNCAENGKICEMVMDYVSPYHFPVVHGLPFGHGSRNDVIPFGAPFVMNTREGLLGILEPPITM